MLDRRTGLVGAFLTFCAPACSATDPATETGPDDATALAPLDAGAFGAPDAGVGAQVPLETYLTLGRELPAACEPLRVREGDGGPATEARRLESRVGSCANGDAAEGYSFELDAPMRVDAGWVAQQPATVRTASQRAPSRARAYAAPHVMRAEVTPPSGTTAPTSTAHRQAPRD